MTERPIVLSVAAGAGTAAVIAAAVDRLSGEVDLKSFADAPSALAFLEQHDAGEAPIALVVAEQRLDPTGARLLRHARERHRGTRRVLLTRTLTPEPAAWGDGDESFAALQSGDAHAVVSMPLSDPDALWTEIEGQLGEWLLEHHGGRGAIVLVGDRAGRRSHELRDVLERNRMPYRWVESDSPEARALLTDRRPEVLPAVLLPDGTALGNPTNLEVAEALGVRTRPDDTLYDVAVVGAGPARLAAAVYGASEDLATLLIEREATGGQAGTSSRIENYLGFPGGISGGLLAEKALAQAMRFGTTLVIPQAVAVLDVDDRERRLHLVTARSPERAQSSSPPELPTAASTPLASKSCSDPACTTALHSAKRPRAPTRSSSSWVRATPPVRPPSISRASPAGS